MKKIFCALMIAILIQIPLGYFFTSLEGLVLGDGFIGAPSGIVIYLESILLVAAVVILLIGLPVYFTLKHFKLNTTVNIAAIGFAIPVVILCLLSFGITDYEGYSAGENYYGTYRTTFVSGTRTLWGWVKFFEEIATFGIHGILGAIIFHKIYGRRSKT
jgi:hypothetical protein